MSLHFAKNPLMLIVKQILNGVHVFIRSMNRHIQFGWSIFQNIVNMGVDGVNFLTDGIHRTTQFRLGTLILLNGRLQFKCGALFIAIGGFFRNSSNNLDDMSRVRTGDGKGKVARLRCFWT